MRRLFFYILCLVTVVPFSAALASPIISPSGATVVSVTNSNPLAAGIVVSNSEYIQTSWSTTDSLERVSISAWLFGTIVNGSYLPASGTAYLTSTSLGSPLQEDFIFPDTSSDARAIETSLFSNLNLSAGTYYLTLASTSVYGGGWADSLENGGLVQTQLGYGVGLGPTQFASSGNVNPSDPPASQFTPGSDQVFFRVTAVPEPSSIVLVGTTSLALIARLRMRKRI